MSDEGTHAITDFPHDDFEAMRDAAPGGPDAPPEPSAEDLPLAPVIDEGTHADDLDGATPEPDDTEVAERLAAAAAEEVPPGYGPAPAQEVEAHKDLQESNARRMKALARGNPPMELSAIHLVGRRFEMLLDELLPKGTTNRVRFEILYQQSVAEGLDEAFAAQRQASIQQGAPQGGGLIVPGR